MNLESKSGRRVRRAGAALGLVAAMLLASCGGGTLVDEFSPQRIVSFGDETSALVPATSTTRERYGVNYIDNTTGLADCTRYPVWTQYLAASYNLPFPECGAGNTPSRMRAVKGAKETGLAAQIDLFLATDALGEQDLVTIMIGANDVLEQYDLIVGGTTKEAAQAVLVSRAQSLAAQVNRVIGLGPRVLISTIVNPGLTPYGLADGSGVRAATLYDLTKSFNDALRTALRDNTGREVALVLADEIVRLDSVDPGRISLDNTTTPSCPVPDTESLLSCTNVSIGAVTSGLDPATYLWAGNLMLGPGPQSQIGSEAYSRATNNPF